MTKRTDYLHDVRSFSQDRLANPLLRNITIFTIGLIVGWFVFGWLLFPATRTDFYPNELHPEVVNDYLLMTAESYGATGDLRTAAKRLRYWEPEQLAAMFNDLAQSVETSNPADAAYLRLLARDLHLSSAAHAVSTSTSRTIQFNFRWLLVPILALAVLAGLILLAQKFGWLNQRALQESEDDALLKEEPFATTPEELEPYGPPPTTPTPARAEEEERPLAKPEPEEGDDALFFEEEVDNLPEEEPDFLADEVIDTIPEPDDVQSEAPVETPEAIPMPPLPDDNEDVIADLEPDIEEEDGGPSSPPRVLRFDGAPHYNMIIAIESGDEYLGEYGMSAGRTAPSNPNMVLTLEVWLFDKSDTQTADIALAPPIIVADPELKSRYVKENISVLPLQEGQIILLETAELRLEGRVRRVKFGPVTHDGVPIIEEAEIEMLGKRK